MAAAAASDATIPKASRRSIPTSIGSVSDRSLRHAGRAGSASRRTPNRRVERRAPFRGKRAAGLKAWLTFLAGPRRQDHTSLFFSRSAVGALKRSEARQTRLPGAESAAPLGEDGGA